MQPTNRILKYLKSLDWYVLLAVPVLSVVLGALFNLCVSEEKRVKWSGVRGDGDPDEIAMLEVRRGAWTSYAVSVQVQDGDYHVTLYASGSKPQKRVFKKLDYHQTDQDVTFGRGFGWNWHLDGEVALFMVFDRPLTWQEILELDRKSPFKL